MSTGIWWRICVRFLTGLTVAAASSATSAATGAAEGTSGSPSSELTEIVVTAQKRSEHLQDVPIQVDVLTARSIQAQQIKETTDVVARIPNFVIEKTDTYTNSVIVLRGISQASNADMPVAVLVDGVPQDDAKQFNMHLFDVAQIEVLKGPQGSLYGRNAEAGAIIVTTARPTNETKGFADLSYGNGATLDASAGLSGAVVPDRVQYRLAASLFTSDGLIRNTATGVYDDRVTHDWTLRGNLLFLITDRLKLDLIGQYGEFNAAGVYFAPVFSGNPNDFQLPQGNFPNRGSGTKANVTLKLEDELGFATLTAISGYTRLTQVQTTDVDFTPHPVVGDNQPFSNRIMSQEVRLVGPSDAGLRWLASVDYLNAHQFISTNIFLDRGHPATDPTDPAGIILSNPADNNRADYGASGQLNYDVAPALTLTAGIRYDHDRRTQLSLAGGQEREANFSKLQPKVTASYKFDPQKLAYLTYGVGFRSGGFNPPSFSIPLYDAEKINNVELGAKTLWFDRRLTLNAALFVSQVDQYQFSYIDFKSGSEVTGNIDRVRIRGAEIEAQLNPVDGLAVFVNSGYAEPKIREFGLFPQFVGNITPRAAKLSLSGGIDYTRMLPGGYSLQFRADAQHYGERYWFVDNLDVQQAKTFVNGSIGVARGAWTLTLWGKNIGGTKAYDTYFPSQSTGLPYAVAYPNRPKTYGAELVVRY